MPLRSNAKPFPGSTSPRNKYRDRQTITAPDGSKKDIQGYGATKNEATADFIRKAEAFIHEHANVRTITVAQLAERWLENKALQGRKRRTLSAYRDVIKNHIVPAIGDEPIASVTLGQLQTLQHKIVRAGKYRTAQLVVMVLKSLYELAARTYRSEHSIPNLARDLDTVQEPHSYDPKDAIWTHAQIDQFLTIAKAEYDNLTSLYYPLYLTSISVGLRRGELLGLRWQDVGRDENGPYIFVVQQITVDSGKLYIETPKTPMSTRRVPLPEAIFEMLMAHRELLRNLGGRLPGFTPSDLVFPSFSGGPISPSNLRRSYLAQIDKAGSVHSEYQGETARFQKWRALRTGTIYSVHHKYGLEGASTGTKAYLNYTANTWRISREPLQPELPPIYFHSLRKCAATYITQALVDAGRYAPKIVAQILGHSKVDVALEVYTKVVNQDLQYAIFNPLEPQNPNRHANRIGPKKGG